MLQQFLDEVGVEVGYLVILVLGLGGRWVGRYTFFFLMCGVLPWLSGPLELLRLQLTYVLGNRGPERRGAPETDCRR